MAALQVKTLQLQDCSVLRFCDYDLFTNSIKFENPLHLRFSFSQLAGKDHIRNEIGKSADK